MTAVARRIRPILPARILEEFRRQPAIFREGLLGVTAVFTAFIILLIAFAIRSSSKGWTIEEYTREAEQRTQVNEFEAARVCYERLALLVSRGSCSAA